MKNLIRKRIWCGVNHTIHHSPTAPPLSLIGFQPTAYPQSQVSSSGKAGGLAQVGLSNLGLIWAQPDVKARGEESA